ncbi:MAG: rRNA pseudouridine synthase [Planctomycetes bacterium]|nr:rRNA pseudouridine synthase [Planctomycetota bacterium]
MSRGWSKPEAADPNRYKDASRGPRLHKILADAGFGSRRSCETLIESGAVEINGQVVNSLPAWADPVRDRIEVDGERVRPPARPVYVMLFKPRGVVCTNEEGDRRRAIDLVVHPSGARLYPVGRLDVDSSGLLLLTNDGDLANRVTHPRYGVHKTYEVTVEGSLDEADVRKLESGVFLTGRRGARRRRPRPGKPTQTSRLRLMKRGRDRTKLLMELREGRNRQVRRMMLYVGHKVRKLRRVRLGSLKLTGLRPGQWRDLTEEEVATLKKIAYRKRPSNDASKRRKRGAS